MPLDEIGPASVVQWAKYVRARCLAQVVAKTTGEVDIVAVTEKLYGSSRRDSGLVEVAKAAVATGATSGAWGSELYSPAKLDAEFAVATMRVSLPGRLRALAVPFSTRFTWVDASSSFDWVQERAVIPTKSLSLADPVQIDPAKLAGIFVTSNALLEHSESESVIARDASRAMVGAIDRNFLDPAVTATAGHPASITNGLTPIAAGSPTTPTLVDAVLQTMLNQLITAGSDLARAHFLTTPTVAAGLATLRGTDHAVGFPGITATGGVLAGLPVLTSRDAPASQIVLVDADEVLLADEGVETVLSRNADVDMDSAPAGSNRVSMYGTESTAIRIIRRISWRMRRPFVSVATGFLIA